MTRTWQTPAAALVAALALIAPVLALTAPVAAAEPGEIVLNEVEIEDDWIELTNTTDAAIDISGYVIKDDKDDHAKLVPATTVLDPGAFFAMDVKEDPDGFGLGKADAVRVFLPDGTTEIATFAWEQEPATSYGRCPDGTGEFIATVAVSKGEANVCDIDPADAIVINEVESQNGEPGDWVELKNVSGVSVDAGGLWFKDSEDDRDYTIPADTVVAAGGYLVLDEADFDFGLGGADSARLFAADGTTVIDETAWVEHASTTIARCADGVGGFAVSAASTKGAANDCVPPAAAGTLVVNELESNGDDTDWVELMNLGDEAIDISGYYFRDNDDSRDYTLPAGSIVPAGGLFVVDQESATNPGGFDFGFGDPDVARLYGTDGATLIASFAYDDHAAVSWGRCPDGTGNFVDTTVSTKGTPNDCTAPIRINEVESSDGDPGDWIELTNVGSEPVDASGFVLKDDNDSHSYPLPAGSMIAPGAFLVVDELADSTPGFDFGFGGADTARLYAIGGVTLVDEYSWTEHSATTFGRCPDGTGEFAATVLATKGAANQCEGIITPEPWIGGADVTTLDDENTISGDLSGVDYEPSGTSAPGILWAVQNGDGLLYRFVSDGADGWIPDPANGWANGKTLRYGDGTGTVDAEGVTVVNDDSTGGVYVSSERNNDASSVSRPSILRFDVSGSGTELVANAEWNLAADFEGLGANQGLEGVTWIPDGYLEENGFVDSTSGLPYQPSDYPGHGEGLFLIGVEGTANVYAYALMADDSFQRIATIATPFELVADVQFDADLGALWVVCDEGCDGRIALFEIAPPAAVDEFAFAALATTAGEFGATRIFDRPAGMANIANEGFAVADDATCTGGFKSTFYADDADTDGFSLRLGSMQCAALPGPAEPAGENLPSTGTDSTATIALALALLLAGALVALGRRRAASQG